MLCYRYRQLQYNDSIRILVLHPSSNDSDSIICTIQHVRLSDASLKYEAVSYTWGDIAQKQAIHFHGGRRELLVGKNCRDALWRLRQESRDRLLWIDAICINQENLSERARQVRIMDDVFSRASNVVVFLGEQTAGSRALFEELAAADKLLTLEEECHRPSPSDVIVQELETLYARPWFKRVWVLQEVCAKDSVIFMCGSASASFDALKRLYFGYSQNKMVTKVRWPLALEWIYRPPEERSTPQFNLWHRLYESRNCLATDPRDRIFALKSLAGSRQSELDPLINYTQSLEECFTQVADFLLHALGLRMLTAIRHPHDKDMPSWIPDWSQTLPLDPIYSYLGSSLDLAASECGRDFRSINKRMYQVRMISGKEDGNRLELLTTGCQYATIIDRSQTFSFDSAKEAEIQMRRLYHSHVNLRNVFAVVGMQDDRTMSEHLGQNISMAMSLIDGPELHLHLARQTGGIFEPNARAPVRGGQIENFMNSLQQCRISLLENGELAIIPASLRHNDVIYILTNTDSACALRPDGKGNWTLVSGDCYIFAEVSRLSLIHGGVVLDEYIACHQDKVEDFLIR